MTADEISRIRNMVAKVRERLALGMPNVCLPRAEMEALLDAAERSVTRPGETLEYINGLGFVWRPAGWGVKP